jgi:hypothetical protein
MPSKSPKQQRFMGSELSKKRSGKPTKTNMSEGQLRDFASGGSLEDIEAMEGYAERSTVMNGEEGGTHAIHKGYDDCVYGDDRGWKEDGDEPKGSEFSANRDNGWGLHYGAPVEYFGPDTNYRAEEINPQDYGRDYDPFPFRDMFKDQKKDTRQNLRLLEEAEYAQLRTPGTIDNKAFESSLAHGSTSYEKVPTDLPDSRGFGAQQKFRRSSGEPDEDTPKVSGRDTKHGKNIR